jgi:hypothetical protein
MSCRTLGIVVCAIVMTLAAGVANADIVGTYVDATTSNTTPSSAFSATESDTDNLWYVDTGRTYCENGDIMAANTATETSPILTTTVTELANGSYDVYAVFWTHTSAGWAIDAKLANAETFEACNQWNGTATGTETSDKIERYQLLGQAVVTDGSFAVNVAPRLGYDRGWYDGVSYQRVVPEPSAVALVVMGALSLTAYAWRKRKQGVI